MRKEVQVLLETLLVSKLSGRMGCLGLLEGWGAKDCSLAILCSSSTCSANKPTN